MTEDRRRKNKRRAKLKSIIDEVKKRGCSLCGYRKSTSAMEFHHIDEESKTFDISKIRGYSFSRVTIELNKCLMVCANCHREIHDGLVPKKEMKKGMMKQGRLIVAEQESLFSEASNDL